jgi:hypothetical protein
VAGIPIKDLVSEFKIDPSTVTQHVKRAGVRLRLPALLPEEVEEASQLYRSGQSLRRVGSQFGVRDTTIRTALLRAGVKMRTPKRGNGAPSRKTNRSNDVRSPRMREPPSTEPHEDAAELEAALRAYELDARVETLAFASGGRITELIVVALTTGGGLAYVEFCRAFGKAAGQDAYERVKNIADRRQVKIHPQEEKIFTPSVSVLLDEDLPPEAWAALETIADGIKGEVRWDFERGVWVWREDG